MHWIIVIFRWLFEGKYLHILNLKIQKDIFKWRLRSTKPNLWQQTHSSEHSLIRKYRQQVYSTSSFISSLEINFKITYHFSIIMLINLEKDSLLISIRLILLFSLRQRKADKTKISFILPYHQAALLYHALLYTNITQFTVS